MSEQGVSRRELLRRTGIGAAAAAPLLGVAGRAAAATGTAATLSPAEVAKIGKLIGPINPRYSGKGTTLTIGSVLAFSGAGNYYGREMSQGINLAVKHIAALGGPTIKVNYRDHASGDPQKGVQAAIALKGLPVAITSYAADGGSMLPNATRYHLLMIDPGGGNGPPYDRKPYLWGFRAIPTYDALPVTFEYIRKKLPQLKTLALMFPDFGPATDLGVKEIKKYTDRYGLEIKGVVKPKWGATDFSAEIAAVRAIPSDFIYNVGYQLDVAYFLKQYKVSGIDKPIFGPEVVGPPVKVGGPAYDGYYYAQDDFNPAAPANPWAEIFVKDFRATYGDSGIAPFVPDFYSAGYYDATFVVWALLRELLAAKKNLKDGAVWQETLAAHPRFPSVFGGSATAAGTVEFNTVTHGLKHRPVALFQIRKGRAVRLATGDIGGKNIRIVA